MQVQIVKETFLKAISPEIHTWADSQPCKPADLSSRTFTLVFYPSFVFISLSCKYNIPTHVAP